MITYNTPQQHKAKKDLLIVCCFRLSLNNGHDTMGSTNSDLTQLPEEILLSIFAFLDIPDLLSLSRVSDVHLRLQRQEPQPYFFRNITIYDDGADVILQPDPILTLIYPRHVTTAAPSPLTPSSMPSAYAPLRSNSPSPSSIDPHLHPSSLQPPQSTYPQRTTSRAPSPAN